VWASDCDDADSVGDVATHTATIHVAAGERARCTFRNEVKISARDNTVKSAPPLQNVGVGVLDNDLGSGLTLALPCQAGHGSSNIIGDRSRSGCVTPPRAGAAHPPTW
jgi:hypothetical protein